MKSLLPKRMMLISILIFCITHSALAQSIAVQGKVHSESNPEGLSGVTVTVSGTTNATSTDKDGVFHLTNVNPNGSLVFTSIGFKDITEPVNGRSQINLQMEVEESALDQVVVIGYGTARKKDVTGAVASVKTADLEKEAPRSIQDLLRGNAAGIIIGQGNSAKADASLLIRGSGTLKAGNSPLHVVDGVIFDGALSDINPNDIQSIDILKDASAAAVFGAKSANGVVLITTKKGVSGDPKITMNANLGMVQNARMPRVFNSEEFLDFRYDYEMGRRADSYHQQYPEMFMDPKKLKNVSQLDWYNYDQNTPVTSVNDDQLISAWLSRLELKSPEIENYFANNITDWQDLVFQTGFQQDYTVSISNRTDKTSYYFSLNHVDREGIITGNRYKNFRTRLNLESRVTSFLKIGVNTNFAIRNEGFLQSDWEQSTRISPYGSNNLGDPNSVYQRLPTGDPTPVNPFYDNIYRDRKDLYSTINSSLYAVVSLPLGIELQSNFTPSLGWREYYNHESSKSIEWSSNGGASERTFQKTFNWQIDNILRWKKEFGVHNVEVTLLQNAEKGQYWSTKATTSNYNPSDILGYHRLQAGTVPLNESDDTYRTGDALMGRLFYSFKDRYMLTASVRRDGYSAFGAQNPRATFPALAFAWDFSEEKFMSKTNSWLDYSKLRLSWGKNGNRDIGQYEALSDMTSGLHPYIDQNGNLYVSSQLYVNRMANLGLRWESRSAYNIGLDFSVLKNRLSGSFDAYRSTTIDLLVDRALPEIIGFNSVAANLGQLENKGFEFSLNGEIIRKKNFNWKSSFIFMWNRREIVSLYGDMIDVKDADGKIIGQKEADDIKNRWFIGQDPDRIWDYERIGVWQLGQETIAAKYGNQPGDFRYKDQNGDSLMTDADRVFQGFTTPRARWSWRNEFNYKGLSLSLFIYSNWGQYGTLNRAANNSSFADRTTDYATPRWTRENPINDYGRIGSKNIGSNYIDRSFIRLDNISLSYGIPRSFINKYKIQDLRVSASVRNVNYWSPHWTFGDPESGASPTPRTYNLSINVTL